LLKQYYILVKPGIVYGNAIACVGGYLLAAKNHIDSVTFASVFFGTALIIACGCVYNNYLDRGIDKKMSRTNKRPLVSGAISNRAALLFGTVLGLAGFSLLISGTNTVTVLLGVIGLVAYVILYGWSKRHSVHGTLVGTISGATPPVAGYTAVTGHFDLGAALIFLILVLWQMPHFFAIGIFRRADYKAAGLPILPVVKGNAVTKKQILAYIVAFICAVFLFKVTGYAGYTFLAVMAALGFAWFWTGLRTYNLLDDTTWARKMFFISLLLIIALPVMMSVNAFLP
jgi:protoheme IX farnesyltransferase